jgi:hypothetical protein
MLVQYPTLLTGDGGLTIMAEYWDPKHLKGEALFKHMLQRRLNDSIVKSRAPIMYLDVQHSEDQVKYFGPDTKYLRKYNIMSYAHGAGTVRKLATRKLDNLGYVKSYGNIQSDPEWLRHLTNRVEFSKSLMLRCSNSRKRRRQRRILSRSSEQCPQ